MNNTSSDQGTPEVSGPEVVAKGESSASAKLSGKETDPKDPQPHRVTTAVDVILVIALAIVLLMLLAFVASNLWHFQIALLPLVLVLVFLVVDVLIFFSKSEKILVGQEKRDRVFSADLRLLAFGASLGLALIGVKWVGEALTLQAEDRAWEAWQWALRLLCAVLVTSLGA